jgi:ABC-type branched-subunit amino acid transport system permease subunit
MIGYAFYVGLTHVTKDFANVGTLLTGAILIVVVLRLPDGVIGYLQEQRD